MTKLTQDERRNRQFMLVAVGIRLAIAVALVWSDPERRARRKARAAQHQVWTDAAKVGTGVKP